MKATSENLDGIAAILRKAFMEWSRRLTLNALIARGFNVSLPDVLHGVLEVGWQ
ncbi:MAG: hypothetical protein WBA76_04980 [Phormidesmis sp.]